MSYFITKACAKCHYCELECPAQAISFHGIDYVIDQDKCVRCGLCAKLCPVSAIKDTEAVPVEKHEPVEISCDLAVIGAGGSGLVAAVKFVQLTGKKAVVLEKAKKPGGSTVFAHGFGAIYSKMQREAGDPDAREQVVKRSMDLAGGLYDEDFVRKMVYSTGEFFDWLCSLGGYEGLFELTGSEFGPQDASAVPGTNRIAFPKRTLNKKCTDQAVGPGWMGSYVVEHMLQKCRELGIEVLTGTAAEKIITGPDGAVCGIDAADEGGRVYVDCRMCLVAAGGCSFNDELIRKIEPQFFSGEYIRQSAPTTTGDGILMAESIGAKIAYEDIRVPMQAPAHHPFGYCGYRYYQQDETVIVNLKGRRFIAEDRYGFTPESMGRNAAHIRSTNGIAYAIADSAMIERFTRELIKNPPDKYDAEYFKNYKADLAKDAENDVALFIADSFEGIAAKLSEKFGTDPGTLVDELERYNGFCRSGRDEDFGKDPSHLTPLATPPFYAFYGQGFSEGTYGGIVTDNDLRALDASGRPIKGLYAVGDNAQGFNRAELRGPAAAPLSDLTWAVNSGYQAAIAMAKDDTQA